MAHLYPPLINLLFLAVGELKVLYHPGRNKYRLLMRREQIHKLVLNQAITPDFVIDPMKTSSNSFLWAALNHAEGEPVVEKLAARFKSEALAKQFKDMVDECVGKLNEEQ